MLRLADLFSSRWLVWPRPSRSSPKKCVVIGNGPSLRGFDLTRLSNIDTIGMNAAYRHWERIGWYPTHYACLDDEMIDTHHVEIARLIDEGLCETAFLSGQFLFHHPQAADDDRFVFFDQFDRYWFEQRGSQFNLQNHIPEDAFECTQFEFFEKMTTGSHAVRYAIWRGYTHIALIGIDLKYVSGYPKASPAKGSSSPSPRPRITTPTTSSTTINARATGSTFPIPMRTMGIFTSRPSAP